MTAKRLPQVGETWWDEGRRIIGPLVPNNGTGIYPLWCRNVGRAYTKEGVWAVEQPTSNKNLLHIHSDATGKVINPEFPTGDTVEITAPPAPAQKPTKTQREIAATEKRLADLRELDRIERDILAKHGEMAELKAGKAALVAKIYGGEG